MTLFEVRNLKQRLIVTLLFSSGTPKFLFRDFTGLFLLPPQVGLASRNAPTGTMVFFGKFKLFVMESLFCCNKCP